MFADVIAKVKSIYYNDSRIKREVMVLNHEPYKEGVTPHTGLIMLQDGVSVGDIVVERADLMKALDRRKEDRRKNNGVGLVACAGGGADLFINGHFIFFLKEDEAITLANELNFSYRGPERRVSNRRKA